MKTFMAILLIGALALSGSIGYFPWANLLGLGCMILFTVLVPYMVEE